MLASMWAGAGPAPAQVHTYPAVQPRPFEMLRSHAQAFVSVKGYQGYTLDAGQPPAEWFQIRYQGRPVLTVQNTPAGLVVRVSPGVALLAPDILVVRDGFRTLLEPLDGSGGG